MARSFLFALALGVICVPLGHTQSSWKEYTFPKDGFAVTLPYGPTPHPDANNPDMTVYTVQLPTKATFSLRVVRKPHDCAATIGLLRDGARAGKQPGIVFSSINEFSLDAHPGVEYEFNADPAQKRYERYYCVNKRFYIFSARWPATNPRPAAVSRMVRSFRLIGPN